MADVPSTPASQPRRGKTRKSVVTVLVRRQYVFALRCTGATYDAILQAAQRRFQAELPRSYCRRSVSQDVLAEIRQRREELNELVDTARELELERLDKMLLANWAAAVGRPADLQRGLPAQPPDLAFQQMVLNIMARRAKYLPGIEAPIKIAPTTPDGQEPYQPTAQITDTYVAQVAALLAQYGELSTAQTDDPNPQDDDGLDTEEDPLPPYTNGATH